MQTVHATSVALNGRGILIQGASGSGKSSLALTLIGLGCDLISDDRTVIFPDLMMQAPPTISGMIEARGIGILRAPAVTAKLALVIDMDRTETERLPPKKTVDIQGKPVPCLYVIREHSFAFSVIHYMKYGRI